MKNDPVNHPSHYTDGKIEVIDFIEDKNLCFHLGNTVKYVARAGKKDPDKIIEDLKKAKWYLERKIQNLEMASDKEINNLIYTASKQEKTPIKYNKFKDAYQNKIIKMHHEGISAHKISRLCKVSLAFTYRFLKETGIYIKGCTGEENRKMDKATELIILQKYRDNERVSAIGKELGIEVNKIYRFLKMEGVFVPKHQNQKPTSPLAIEKAPKAVELWKEGYNATQIASKLNIHRSTVWRFFHHEGFNTKDFKQPSKYNPQP
ncbi:MAG: DUF3310 domain-containing protein [Flavobacteriales bacterium]|nr:DUF3310 domain-containing protein [Flavobacteriales bacterium]